jgi:hypothetical protein
LYKDKLDQLVNGESVELPDDRGGAILGTYLGPCRAIGLVLDGDETVPYRLTPRGRNIWEVRRKRLQDSPIIDVISSGASFSRALAESAIPDFSLGSLANSGEEVKILRDALVSPWDPGNQSERDRVDKAYNGINGTIAWANALLALEPANASGLLIRNLRRSIEGESQDRISFAWAEYEYRRRCHFSLELLLAALTTSLAEFEEASIAQIVAEWMRSFEISPLLADMWPRAIEAWNLSAIESVASVPKQLFSDERIPVRELRQLVPSNQALAAVAILVAAADQTKKVRRDGHFEQKPYSPGERAVDIIETPKDEPFPTTLERLVGLAALAHLRTTLRKMGAGQKCSLRFFPDGALMRPTGIGASPGQSNDRLTDVLRILTDVGELHRENGRFRTI